MYVSGGGFLKSILDFSNYKRNKIPISMITCYDACFANLIGASDIDCILVGDSIGMTLYGHSNTLSVDVELMRRHTEAVFRGALGRKFIVTDVPFCESRKGIKNAVSSCQKLIIAGANAVKIEGLDGHQKVIPHLAQSGIPVMGHLGLTPQLLHQLGGFVSQGKTTQSAKKILDDAKILEQLGCFALVLECIPQDLAQEISLSLSIPTIGIGSGPFTDGQVLVLHDVLGLSIAPDGSNCAPKFAPRYVDLANLTRTALKQFAAEVKKRSVQSNIPSQ